MRDRIWRNGALLVAVLALTTGAVVQAGSWSAEQQGVWKDVQAYWEAWTKGDVDGFMAYVHPDYVGWSVDEPLPSGKESGTKWMKFWAARNSVEIYEVRPVEIAVHGSFAVVYYYYSYVSKDQDGKLSNHSGRWVDVLIKDGSTWKLIGDHGGEMPKDD